VVVSAIQSKQHPGFVECIAMLGGRRSTGFRAPAGEQRRYLVDEALYDIGAFGFVIDEPVTANIRGRRASLAGPSREMRRQTGKSARHARTGRALRPAQRQADDRRNRRLKTHAGAGPICPPNIPTRCGGDRQEQEAHFVQDEPAEPH
jgi:hypothetical protein